MFKWFIVHKKEKPETKRGECQLPILNGVLVVFKTNNISSVYKVPLVCYSLTTCLGLKLMKEHVQNAFIEHLVVQAQWTVQDIEVGEGAPDVKERIKELTAKCPFR